VRGALEGQAVAEVGLPVVADDRRPLLAFARGVVRAVITLGMVIPFFLLLFASFYLSLAATSAASFSQQLDHSGSLYFTVTVFATVGFGDIVPVTAVSRLVTSVQMLLDLVVLGAVVRIVIFAARRRIDEK
jgi:hypothetical protein